MLSFGIGPLLIAVNQAILVGALVIAWGAGRLVAGRQRVALGDTLLTLALVGFVTARLVFVGHYFSSYGLDPLAWVDIRDGGFDRVGGLLGAAVYAAYRFWRVPPLRRPLGVALVAGALTWSLASAALTLLEPAPGALPDVSLQTLDGQTTDLTQLHPAADSRPLVVNLWASWCPPCRKEMPVLEQAQQRHADVQFVFANQSESPAAIQRFLRSQELNLDHVVRDRRGGLAQQVGSAGLPTTLFYDARGRLVDTHVGPLSRATLARSLERIQADSSNHSSNPQAGK